MDDALTLSFAFFFSCHRLLTPVDQSPTTIVVEHRLGLNLEIKDGKLAMLEPFTVCTEGKAITPEQAKLMTHLDLPLVDFRIKLVCRWSDGEFEELL